MIVFLSAQDSDSIELLRISVLTQGEHNTLTTNSETNEI
jgi:hypothetical protein